MILQEEFETQWVNAKPKMERIARSYLPRGASFDVVEDFIQDTALKLWRDYEDKTLSGDLPDRFRAAAKLTWWNLRSREQRRPKLETQPQAFFDERTRPFTDIWGRVVPSEHWRYAESYSLAPLDWDDEVIRRHPALYYISTGASVNETAQIIGVEPYVLRQALRLLKRRLISAGSSVTLSERLKTELPFLPVLRFPPIPAAPRLLRTLPGFMREWLVWFAQLSKITSEPITLHLIRRLARQDPRLTEEQGMRFLLAASTERASLLSQKFIDLNPNAKGGTLSFSEIYQLMRGEGHPTPDSPYGVSVNRMNQIATFWSPTARWYELKTS